MVIGGHGEHVLPVWNSVTICGGRGNAALTALLENMPERQKLQGF